MQYIGKGQISFDDFVNFNKSHLKQSYKTKTSIIIGFIALPCFVFLLVNDIIDLLSGNKSFIDSTLFLFAIIAISLFISITFLLPHAWKKSFSSNTILSNPQEILIDNEKISQINANGTLILTKDKIHHIRFELNAIYVYIAKNQAILIPSHYFNEVDFKDVKQFIKSTFSLTTAST